MQKFMSALVAVVTLGSAMSGTSPISGSGPGRYEDIIKRQRPLRLDIAPTMLARAYDMSNTQR